MRKYLSRTIQQIPLEQMERGLARPVATLRLEPAEITSRSGLTFETTHDDLDELQAAVFRVVSGQEFALVRHRHQAQPGTDILINEKLHDLAAALRDALQGLQFEPRELRWTHPRIDVAKLKLSSDVRTEDAEIRKQIGRLKVGPEEVLRAEKEPNELTHKASAALHPTIRARGRGRSSDSSSKQLVSPRDFWNSPDQQSARQMMTLNEIQALISSGENESKYLEFKESRALPEKTTNRFREELSKDVSSFANSAGGKIIYGVAENPLRLDAFDRKLCSLERLQNLINSHISPKIPGLHIYPIPVEDGQILYVVEIPQGKTAHQAADRKYYKRHEGTIEAMEDYEIRDVMARSSGIETKLLLAIDLSRSHTKSENRETHRPGRHFQVSVINEGNKVSNWCVAEISAAPRTTWSDVSSHFSAPVGSQMLEVFTFSNYERLTEQDKIVTETLPRPLLPHRSLPLGWITLFDGNYYEESKSKGVGIRMDPPFDTLYWKIYCDEGRPSSGEYSLRELARRYDEFRSKHER